MAKPRRKKYYAYLLLDGESGVMASWADCEAKVSGRNARYRGFPTKAEAKAWLEAGALYEARPRAATADLPQDGVFFDAGTGGGKGARARVTDRHGVPLTYLAVDENRVDPDGNVPLPGRTNNFAELFACNLALSVAQTLDAKIVLGDSKLVFDFWSLGHVSLKLSCDQKLVALARETAKARAAFEAKGGRLKRISGDVNPADLGFHRP